MVGFCCALVPLPVTFKTPSTDSYYGGESCGGKKYSEILRVFKEPENPSKFRISLKDCSLEPKWYERFVRDVIGLAKGAAGGILGDVIPGIDDPFSYLCYISKDKKQTEECKEGFDLRLDNDSSMVIVFSESKAKPLAIQLEADAGSKGRWFNKSVLYSDVLNSGTGDKLIAVYHWGKMATAMNIP